MIAFVVITALNALDNESENVKIKGNLEIITLEGGETGSTGVKKFTLHAEVPTSS